VRRLARYELYKHWRELRGSADAHLLDGTEKFCAEAEQRLLRATDAHARAQASASGVRISADGFPLSALDVADADTCVRRV
jgi:hypothetical protein